MPNFKIKPFKGLLYNQAKVKDLSKVVTPPYDVINQEMQKEFYERSTFNFVRVDLSPEPGDLRYESAQKVFRQWVNQQVMVKDSNPAFYFHHQTFTLPDGRQITRKGFFGVRKIEDFSEGGIKPHEKTLEGPKADRLKLTRATSAQLSPVFALYSDPGKKIDRLILKLKEQKPVFDFKTALTERHQLWREDNATICQFVGECLENEPLFIADGHHRYETALNYRNECRQKNPGGDPLAPYNDVLMYFTNRHDEGLVILPIHRALHHLHDFELIDLVKNLEKYFKVIPLGPIEKEAMVTMLKEEGVDSHAFIMLTKDPSESYLLSIKRRAWRQSPVAAPVAQSLVGLDVTVLHRLIFEEILRITPEAQANQENIIYWKDTQKAIDETRKGACEVTFLLNPTRIEDMESVALAGEKMPQKSTYFYPKVLSGLVVHPL
ncbi:MAG: DUF1015 domain-containing protein [Deltaproteobacteria bacterium]|nr:DUF1015 domain-containing protein [Deltaproteobacteria bacterium]